MKHEVKAEMREEILTSSLTVVMRVTALVERWKRQLRGNLITGERREELEKCVAELEGVLPKGDGL